VNICKGLASKECLNEPLCCMCENNVLYPILTGESLPCILHCMLLLYCLTSMTCPILPGYQSTVFILLRGLEKGYTKTEKYKE
jgi:hypothetical protein